MEYVSNLEMVLYIAAFIIVAVGIYLGWQLGKGLQEKEEERNDTMLKNMTVRELLDGELFRKELQVQIDNEVASHDKMAREAFTLGMRLQRSPHQRLRDKGVFNVDDLVAAYKMIICKQAKDYSSAERTYIKQVVMMAYWRVVEILKKKE